MTQTTEKQKGNAPANPQTTGKYVKSRMIRVSSEFADWINAQARKAGISSTDITRDLYYSFVVEADPK